MGFHGSLDIVTFNFCLTCRWINSLLDHAATFYFDQSVGECIASFQRKSAEILQIEVLLQNVTFFVYLVRMRRKMSIYLPMVFTTDNCMQITLQTFQSIMSSSTSVSGPSRITINLTWLQLAFPLQLHVPLRTFCALFKDARIQRGTPPEKSQKYSVSQQ